MNCGIVDSFQQFEVHTPFHFETVYQVTKPMPTYVSTPAFWTTLRTSHFKITSQWYQVLLSSNHFNNTIDPISDFQAAVVVTTKEYMEAWGRKDSHGVANCYAEDGIFLVPGRDVLRGRKGVHQAFHKHTCLSVCLNKVFWIQDNTVHPSLCCVQIDIELIRTLNSCSQQLWIKQQL